MIQTTVHYNSDETVNFCGFGCATTSRITVLINFVFTFIFVVFIPLYAETRCHATLRNLPRHSNIAFNFTTLYGMQTWSSDDNSGCPSIGLFDKRVNCDKTEERSVHIFTPYERSFSLVF